MFSYEGLLNLDLRDFRFWLKEARKKARLDEIRELSSQRLAMYGSDSQINRIINSLSFGLETFRSNVEKIAKSNWERLDRLKRG